MVCNVQRAETSGDTKTTFRNVHNNVYLEDATLDLVLLEADGLGPLLCHGLGGVLCLEPDLSLRLSLLVGDERDVAGVYDKMIIISH